MGRSTPIEQFDDDISDEDSAGDRFLIDEGLHLLATYRRIRDPRARKAVQRMIGALLTEQDYDCDFDCNGES